MDLGKLDFKIPIKKNGFREHKYNISSPGQGVRLPLRVGVQVAITIKLIPVCPL